MSAKRKSATHQPKRCPPVPPRTWDQGVFLSSTYVMTAEELEGAICASLWDHYVYGLCLDNGAVFYVGKGVGSRALDHAREAASGEDSEKAAYIRYIGDRLRYTLFLQCSDDIFAKGYEAYLIRGHHDVLTNVVVPSVAVIEKMLEPIDPMERAREELAAVDRYIERGMEECRRALLRVIAGCPPVIRSITDEELAWATGIEDGAQARIAILERLTEAEHGRQ